MSDYFTSGTAVRLDLDRGAASIGYLTEVAYVRPRDGMTFWRVDFGDPNAEPTILAESTLVPVWNTRSGTPTSGASPAPSWVCPQPSRSPATTTPTAS
jgi:hypothetical protein